MAETKDYALNYRHAVGHFAALGVATLAGALGRADLLDHQAKREIEDLLRHLESVARALPRDGAVEHAKSMRTRYEAVK